MNSNGNLHTTIDKAIAEISFGHPAANSLPSDLLFKLCELIESFNQNTIVKVIILKSEGEKIFCAGASFDELKNLNSLQESELFFSGFAKLLVALKNSTKIILGRIQGKAVGGGVGIIAACDYVMATQNAAIKLSELSINIGPFVIAPAIERKIGVAALQELAWAPTNWKNALWAQEKGLYAKVFDSVEELDLAIKNHAHELSNYSSEAITQLKKALWNGTEHWEQLLQERAAVSGKLALSEATKNALNQFKK
jgi:methylglutaconyl-CoA hydratase